MIKTYQNYLIRLFVNKILIVSLVFFSLIVILSVFEEISFFKELDVNFLFPFFMTLLNLPSTLFEIFPFIFLISTQFFFLDLINKNELEVLKINGLGNFKIIKILFFTSFFLGILLIAIYYNFSSKLKFIYLDLKNNHSTDNKYLAVVTENGLWIKDEVEDAIYIINANKIQSHYLRDVLITEFDKNFDLVRTIEATEVDIEDTNWIIVNPIISQDNQTQKQKENIIITTHFNQEKIEGLFRSLSSLNIIELIKLYKDYESLGYDTIDVEFHLHKVFSFPVFLSVMTLFAAIIMLNIKRNKPIIFHGLDTFEGMPKNRENNTIFAEGNFKASKESVEKKIEPFSESNINYFLYKGTFKKSRELLESKLKNRKIAIANIDCDIQESTTDALNIVESSLQIGSILLFDDYNAFNANENLGQRKAFNIFTQNSKFKFEQYFSYHYSGVAFLCVGKK